MSAREDRDPPTSGVPGSPPLFVIAIGASAGGLAALKTFFDAAQLSDSAIVVLQHLDPTQSSAMVELLRTHTRMQITQATDGDPVEPGRVYLLPPAKSMTIVEGTLHLESRETGREGYFPIDHFLRSLAEDQRDKAVAVILTGTGRDGAKGVLAVKEKGGLVLVQDVETAEQAGMPLAALDTGVVDAALPIDEIPRRIAEHIDQALDEGEPIAANEVAHLGTILSILAAKGGQVDFASYKLGTIKRRIERRMAIRGLTSFTQYASFLREDPAEVDRLSHDLLIGVTEFFRDPDAFVALERDVLPQLLEEQATEGSIRAWVSACSTGEEAYSIGMLLIEQCAARHLDMKIHVFATDANPAAIEVARAGVYTKDALAGVSPERLASFFEKVDESRYRATKALRDVITFSTQNLLQDPPFSRLDLLCCRNVLIYLAPHVQQDLATLFHFALRPGGCLFLGSAENLPRGAPFDLISKKWRIYRRDHDPYRPPKATALIRSSRDRKAEVAPSAGAARGGKRTATEVADEWLLDTYSPAAVVINARNDIVSFRGPVENYLNMPRGAAILNILTLSKEGLLGRLRTAIHQATQKHEAIRVTGAVVDRAGGARHVNIRVEPLRSRAAPEGLLMVVFEDDVAPQSSGVATNSGGLVSDATIVRQLEDDLKATKNELDDIIEASDAASEELKAANEEMTSMNEELRSANEELESSKEELQSLNAELNQVNTELRTKIERLTNLSDDIGNYQRATKIPTLVLDKELRITSASPSIDQILHFAPSDVGRPLADIKFKFDEKDFLVDARRVMETLVPIEKQIRTQNGQRFDRNIFPYRTADDRIKGVIITFVDRERTSRAEDAAKAARLAAEAIVELVPDPLIVLSSDARVLTVNATAAQHFQIDPQRTIGHSIDDVFDRRWNTTPLQEFMEKPHSVNEEAADLTLEASPASVGTPSLPLTGRWVRSGENSVVLLSLRKAPR